MARTLSGTTTPGQNEPWSNGNEGVLHIPLISKGWSLAIRLLSVISMTLVGRGSYLYAEMLSVYSTVPADRAKAPTHVIA